MVRSGPYLCWAALRGSWVTSILPPLDFHRTVRRLPTFPATICFWRKAMAVSLANSSPCLMPYLIQSGRQTRSRFASASAEDSTLWARFGRLGLTERIRMPCCPVGTALLPNAAANGLQTRTTSYFNPAPMYGRGRKKRPGLERPFRSQSN